MGPGSAIYIRMYMCSVDIGEYWGAGGPAHKPIAGSTVLGSCRFM